MAQPNTVTAASLLARRQHYDFGCPVTGCPRTYNRPDNVQRHCNADHRAIYNHYLVLNSIHFDYSRVVLIPKQQQQQAPDWPLGSLEWEQEMEDYFQDFDDMDCLDELEQQQPSFDFYFDNMDWTPELEDQRPREEADDLEEELESCYQVWYWWCRDKRRWVVFDHYNQYWTWSARFTMRQERDLLGFGIRTVASYF